MIPHLSRRHFGAGFAALAFVGTDAAAKGSCSGKMPAWATKLETDLERMARDLTARLKPWAGPALVVRPEDYGYNAGGSQIATSAIQAAIDAAAARGGGTVRLSQGDYVSGTLDLRSNIRLEIAKDARLLASLDLKDYPQRIAKRPTVMDSNMGMNQSLLFAEGCTNISLSGEGRIDGRGTKQNFPGAEPSAARRAGRS